MYNFKVALSPLHIIVQIKFRKAIQHIQTHFCSAVRKKTVFEQ